MSEFQAERGVLLSRLMFGWLADAHLGTRRFTLRGDEYEALMAELAEREAVAPPCDGEAGQ